MFLIAIAFLGLIAFGLGWALLGNMAGTLLVTLAWFGTEFDRFLTGLVILGPALGAVCMVAAIWFSLRASGRCRTRREMMRGTAGALAIVFGLGGTAWAANAVRMELYKAKYNLSYTHVAFELRLPAGTRVPAEKGDIRMTLSTPVLDSPAIFGARWASEEWLRRDGDRPVIMGLAPLRARTTDRRVVLQWPGEPERVFRIDRRPALRVATDGVEDGREGQGKRRRPPGPAGGSGRDPLSHRLTAWLNLGCCIRSVLPVLRHFVGPELSHCLVSRSRISAGSARCFFLVLSD